MGEESVNTPEIETFDEDEQEAVAEKLLGKAKPILLRIPKVREAYERLTRDGHEGTVNVGNVSGLEPLGESTWMDGIVTFERDGRLRQFRIGFYDRGDSDEESPLNWPKTSTRVYTSPPKRDPNYKSPYDTPTSAIMYSEPDPYNPRRSKGPINNPKAVQGVGKVLARVADHFPPIK